MELDVTHLVSEDCTKFSDSIANSGREDIGKVTWENACKHAAEKPLVSPEQQDELRSWIREFGAWSTEEIEAMSDTETNALLLQFVAGDIQEIERFDSIEDYRAACEAGNTSGRLYPAENGKWFFYVGS